MNDPAPQRLVLLTEAVWVVETVEAAWKLGVLERLERAPVTIDELVQDCGLSPRHGQLFLSTLVGLGIAEAVDTDRYRATFPGFGQLMCRLLPTGRLTEVLRGRPPGPGIDTLEGSRHFYPTVIRFLAQMSQTPAKTAATLIDGKGLQVLDLGAGAAPWSIAIATRHRDAQVVALDLPEVIPVTRESAVDAGVAHRFGYLEGDFFETDLPDNTYDLIIAGGILHLFDEDANRTLLRRTFRAIRPGGRIAIAEALPHEDLSGPLPVLLYAVGLITRTASGSVYPFSRYQKWLAATGFVEIDKTELSERPSLSLITAVRPRHERFEEQMTR